MHILEKKANCGHGKYYSLGLCRSCYEKQLREKNPTFAENQRKNCRKWCIKNPENKKIINKLYHLTHKEKTKHQKFIKNLSNYNLTENEYNELLKKQNGKCLICGRKPNKQRLHIDHCHKTNWIRGLLCFRCNFGMGWFSDNINTFEKICSYLKGDLGWYKKIKNKKYLKVNKFNSKEIDIGFRPKKGKNEIPNKR